MTKNSVCANGDMNSWGTVKLQSKLGMMSKVWGKEILPWYSGNGVISIMEIAVCQKKTIKNVYFDYDSNFYQLKRNAVPGAYMQCYATVISIISCAKKMLSIHCIWFQINLSWSHSASWLNVQGACIHQVKHSLQSLLYHEPHSHCVSHIETTWAENIT